VVRGPFHSRRCTCDRSDKAKKLGGGEHEGGSDLGKRREKTEIEKHLILIIEIPTCAVPFGTTKRESKLNPYLKKGGWESSMKNHRGPACGRRTTSGRGGGKEEETTLERCPGGTKTVVSYLRVNEGGCRSDET